MDWRYRCCRLPVYRQVFQVKSVHKGPAASATVYGFGYNVKPRFWYYYPGGYLADHSRRNEYRHYHPGERVPKSTSGLANPIAGNLSPERIDQGVDYGGSGPLYAVGAGTITNVYNSGWPGGTYIQLDLSGANLPDEKVYYAEDINPTVSVGQHVTAGQLIGYATGGSSGIEVGYASDATGESEARAAGQWGAANLSTGWGVAFSNLIQSLGGRGGIVHGPVQGSVA